jgi:CHAD domain-containing protein
VIVKLRAAGSGAPRAETVRDALSGLATLQPLSRSVVHDLYLDTRRACLARAGLQARWRRRDDLPVTAASPGLTARTSRVEVRVVPLDPEVEVSGETMEADVRRGDEPERIVRELVERRSPLRLRGAPIVELEVHTTREAHEVLAADGRAELTVITGVVRRRPPRARRGVRSSFIEVQLDALEQAESPRLAACLAALPEMQVATGGRYRYARELVGLPPVRLAPPPPRFGPPTTADEVARLICRAQLAAIRAYAPGSRVGLDPEHVHKMRVATRRLRAALRAFAACFARRTLERLLVGLRWLADALGAVRDLDVQLLELPSWRARLEGAEGEGWGGLRAMLIRRRDAARSRLLALLDSRRCAQLLAAMERAFQDPAGPTPRRRSGRAAGELCVMTARQIIERRSRAFRRAARACRRGPTAARLHELRIRGKKLRYACEFFAPLYGETFHERLGRLGVFQDSLGQFQDGVVLGELVRDLRDEAVSAGSAPDLLYVLGQLAGASHVRDGAVEQRLAEAWEQLGGGETARLLAREARHRAEEVTRALQPGSAGY